jgi:hypothetical protein
LEQDTHTVLDEKNSNLETDFFKKCQDRKIPTTPGVAPMVENFYPASSTGLPSRFLDGSVGFDLVEIHFCEAKPGCGKFSSPVCSQKFSDNIPLP